jgi:hypothetical protein
MSGSCEYHWWVQVYDEAQVHHSAKKVHGNTNGLLERYHRFIAWGEVEKSYRRVTPPMYIGGVFINLPPKI